MRKARIYHNPQCSKSRQTLALLQDRGVDIEIVKYLDTPPSAADVEALIDLLGIEPHDLVRTGEAAYGESGLSKDSSAREVAAAIARSPRLLQRPVVVVNNRAAIGRPPESVLKLFEPISR